jgi:ATP-binding cassette subfamily C protein
MERVECGAAALAIMLAYYGRHVPLAELRQQVGVSRDGSKASNILRAARHNGMTARGFSRETERIRDTACPFIVFWSFNHFLVVEGFTNTHVYLNDPAKGHWRVTWDLFDACFTGVTLEAKPGPGFQLCGKKAGALPGLLSRLSGNWLGVFFVFMCGMLLVIPNIAIPTLTRVFLDSVIIEQRFGWFRPIIIAMGAAALLQLSLQAMEMFYRRRLTVGLAAKLKIRFNAHILSLPVSYYAQRQPAEICTRTELNQKVAGLLAGELASTFVALFTMVLYGAVMLSYDLTLSLISVGAAFGNLFVLKRISGSQTEATIRFAQDSGMAHAVTMSGINSMETLKASGLESGFFERWAGYYAKAANSGNALALSTQPLTFIPQLLSGISRTAILILGGFRVMQGEMTIGGLVAFQSLSESFLGPATKLTMFGSTIQQLQGDILRLDDALSNPVVQHSRMELTGDVEIPPRLSGSLELRNVTFGYSPLEPPLIENLNLKLLPGQRIALVGGSGSGKSTIARIVAGIAEAWSGEVLFDGKPREHWPREIIANSVAIVEQEIFIFSGSVKENLTLWDGTMDDTAVVQACRDAQILEDVLKLRGGIDSQLSEGGRNLSGGQNQRLEIARALARNPSILILDEATSALDTEVERLIDQCLRTRGCTCLIVAHRLSTIRDCDEIICLEGGKVRERGTHAQLWSRQGYYAKLLSHQDGTK